MKAKTAVTILVSAMVIYLGFPFVLLAIGAMHVVKLSDGDWIVFCERNQLQRIAKVVYRPLVLLLPHARFAKDDEPEKLNM